MASRNPVSPCPATISAKLKAIYASGDALLGKCKVLALAPETLRLLSCICVPTRAPLTRSTGAFEEMVRLSFPDLYQVLQETTVINMIGISWFLTLFISAFRLPNCVRIPDCFFFDGPRGMFSSEQVRRDTFRPGYSSQQS
jgi:hypothetical protein